MINMVLYQKSKALQDIVTQKTMHYLSPTREELRELSGFSSEDYMDFINTSWWLMYASSYGDKNNRGDHVATHYNDSAFTANARRTESGFFLWPIEIAQELQHDGPEDISKKIAKNRLHIVPAAYAIMDVDHYLLSPLLQADVRRMLELRSNISDLLFEPVESHFKEKADSSPGIELVVSKDDLVRKIDGTYANFSITQEAIKGFYDALIQRWKYVAHLMTLDMPKKYLPPEEIEYISSTVNGFISAIKGRKDSDFIQGRDIESIVNREVETLKSAILDGELEDIDQGLVPQHIPNIILRTEKTLYTRYVRRMMNSVVQDAFAYAASNTNGKSESWNDSYLYPGLGKFSDARDSATKPGPTMENVISQFRKHRVILREGKKAAEALRGNGIPYDRLWHGMNFLYDGLVAGLEGWRKHYEGAKQSQTQLMEDYEKLEHMTELMKELKPAADLNPVTDSSPLKRISRVIATIRSISHFSVLRTTN